MFDKVYLIKSISAVTNYNSSSCFIRNKENMIIVHILSLGFKTWYYSHNIYSLCSPGNNFASILFRVASDNFNSFCFKNTAFPLHSIVFISQSLCKKSLQRSFTFQSTIHYLFFFVYLQLFVGFQDLLALFHSFTLCQ